MAKRGPLTNEDGDFVRDLSDEDMAWFVRTQDFPSWEAAHGFIEQREAFLEAAEAAGVPRETFLPFQPGKPGFEERARKAFLALPKAVGWAAE